MLDGQTGADAHREQAEIRPSPVTSEPPSQGAGGRRTDVSDLGTVLDTAEPTVHPDPQEQRLALFVRFVRVNPWLADDDPTMLRVFKAYCADPRAEVTPRKGADEHS